MSGVDLISDLPVDESKDSSPELQNVFNIREEMTNNSSFKNEILELVLIVVLFVAVSLPYTANLLENKVPANLIMVAQGVVFAFFYYILKNTFLSK